MAASVEAHGAPVTTIRGKAAGREIAAALEMVRFFLSHRLAAANP